MKEFAKLITKMFGMYIFLTFAMITILVLPYTLLPVQHLGVQILTYGVGIVCCVVAGSITWFQYDVDFKASYVLFKNRKKQSLIPIKAHIMGDWYFLGYYSKAEICTIHARFRGRYNKVAFLDRPRLHTDKSPTNDMVDLLPID